MVTTYTRVNNEVVQYKTDFAVRAEQAYFRWMQKQKTYFGDLLAAGESSGGGRGAGVVRLRYDRASLLLLL